MNMTLEAWAFGKVLPAGTDQLFQKPMLISLNRKDFV
jgi:hypothetical protein